MNKFKPWCRAKWAMVTRHKLVVLLVAALLVALAVCVTGGLDRGTEVLDEAVVTESEGVTPEPIPTATAVEVVEPEPEPTEVASAPAAPTELAYTGPAQAAALGVFGVVFLFLGVRLVRRVH